ncbi:MULTISPECIES: hypothetical protein [Geobacillus]|nr:MULTISPECIES: hypothetical protein [Geobacillus]
MNNNEHLTKRRGMTAEDLLRLRSVRDPHYAPDGTRVVFVEKSIDEENQYRSHLSTHISHPPNENREDFLCPSSNESLTYKESEGVFLS